jgi:AraC-like DNA-binding protein
MSRALSVFHGRFGRATLYELDRPFTPHAHREGHLIFFLGGSPGCVHVSKQPVIAAPRMAVAINPWECHGFTPVSPPTGGLFLVLYVCPSWFQEISSQHGRNLQFCSPKVEITASIERAVDKVTNILLAQRVTPMFDTILFELTELCRIQTGRTAEQMMLATLPRPDHVDFRVRKSVQLLSERFSDDPELDLVARDSGLSRPHFYKLFKEQVGVTPSIYLNTLRMEHAVGLVAAADRSITEISDDLGFSCQSVFTRFFTSHVGMSPSDYRRVARVLNS